MKKPAIVPIVKNARLVVRMLKISWQIRPLAIGGFFLGAIIEIFGFVLSVYATARLGGLLASFVNNGYTEGIWFWLVVDIVAAVLSTMGLFVMSYARRLLYFAFVGWSTSKFQVTMCRIDLQDFYDEKLRNQINKVSGAYTWQLPELGGAVLDLLYGLLRFVVITSIVAQITWWLVPLIAIFLVPNLLAQGRLAKIQWFVWDSMGDKRHIFSGLDHILRQAKGQMELRSTQAVDYVLRRIKFLNNDFYAEQEKKFHQANRLRGPAELLGVVGTTVGSVVLLRQLLNRSIHLDRYFFLSGALIRVGSALNNVFGTLSRMQDSILFAESYFDVIDLQPTIIDRVSPQLLPEKITPKIVFDRVSFAYPGKEASVFEDLSIEISPGEHIAIVGENGAGKSTLIKLLLRLYLPTSGQITVGGVDLQDLSIDSWYEQIATLFQEFNTYPLPISENITIGRSSQEPHQQALHDAAKFGGVDKMVEDYSHGWDTVLDSSFEKGIEPSGGQWQRVALARAFYRQANVLILDEPTAAIDAKAEYDIFNNILEFYKDKTTIIVSHRFSTVRRADRIIVLDKGQIVESGSHKQLIAKKSLYHEMFSKQAEGYR